MGVIRFRVPEIDSERNIIAYSNNSDMYIFELFTLEEFYMHESLRIGINNLGNSSITTYIHEIETLDWRKEWPNRWFYLGHDQHLSQLNPERAKNAKELLGLKHNRPSSAKNIIILGKAHFNPNNLEYLSKRNKKLTKAFESMCEYTSCCEYSSLFHAPSDLYAKERALFNRLFPKLQGKFFPTTS